MNVKQLEALERAWRKGVYRVSYMSKDGHATCPPATEPPVTLVKAQSYMSRIMTVAPLLDIDESSIHVIGADGLPVKQRLAVVSNPAFVHVDQDASVKQDVIQSSLVQRAQTLSVKQRKALLNLDNVDLDLLVNPEALEDAAPDMDD
ncbi:MAG: hypothetical protein EBR99_00020 [Actinobacteria bacterium]|nr:hypothetical protein [Actinomycetota bacterium]